MICFYYQWRISRALDSEDGKARLPTRHMAACPACREFQRRAMELGAAMRSAADGCVEPAGVAAAIAVGSRRPRVIRRVAIFAGATAAAACIIAAIIMLAGNPSRPMTAKRDQPQPTPAPAVTLPDPIQLARERFSVEAMTELARARMAEQLQHVGDEAKAAGRVMLASLPLSFPGGSQE